MTPISPFTGKTLWHSNCCPRSMFTAKPDAFTLPCELSYILQFFPIYVFEPPLSIFSRSPQLSNFRWLLVFPHDQAPTASWHHRLLMTSPGTIRAAFLKPKLTHIQRPGVGCRYIHRSQAAELLRKDIQDPARSPSRLLGIFPKSSYRRLPRKRLQHSSLLGYKP